MMVRDGVVEDLPAVVEMAREFWKETMYQEEFDGDYVEFMASMAIEHGLLAILEIDGKVEGFTAGLKSPLLACADVLGGTEIAYWINPEARRGRNGIALIKHIEGMAKAQGVKYWNMIAMESSMPETVARIYGALGYEKSETSYTRIL
jgi:GNAT superfamily N-acetyltransferase